MKYDGIGIEIFDDNGIEICVGDTVKCMGEYEFSDFRNYYYKNKIKKINPDDYWIKKYTNSFGSVTTEYHKYINVLITIDNINPRLLNKKFGFNLTENMIEILYNKYSSVDNDVHWRIDRIQNDNTVIKFTDKPKVIIVKRFNCKGFKTQSYRIKKKLMKSVYNIVIRET